MSFAQLLHVSRICHSKGHYFQIIEEWDTKRKHLEVYQYDIPKLVDEYRSSKQKPYELNQSITIVDSVPRLRLSSSCEAASNCLYSMAEIAAQFGNKVSNGFIPSSFNKLRKKYEKGEFKNTSLKSLEINFEWYKRVRELRTEWSHYSTIFIGEDETRRPIICVKSHRRVSDRIEFKENSQIRINDLIDWIKQGIVLIDEFGNFLLQEYIIPLLTPDLDTELDDVARDINGWPIIISPGRFKVVKTTVRDYIRKCGITFK
ncbi:hypothetical protein [Francisella salimarina]|uniref:hypothetical protein n=1 Tax=Francisella salimarina TaxID=2599927 RepID=UPI003D81A2BF